MSEELKPVAWARVWAAVKPPHSRNLRAGTWYAVVHDELPDRVSIIVGEQVVDVPRRVLEVRRRRPEEFSVVYGKHGLPRPEGEAARGPRYAVCPACASRFKVAPSLPRAKCPECGHRAEIAW
ncbi:MAG: hypothetical protein PVF27_01635 [Gemmatimonadales bacterium]|jgi:hypothetical protein